MTPEQFCYWLRGFQEIERNMPVENQWKIICDHLDLVFTKKTPERIVFDDVDYKMPPSFPPSDSNRAILC